MNLVTQKYANDLVAQFQTSHQLPGGYKQQLNARRAQDALDTWTHNFDQLQRQDDGPEDLWPGPGKVYTHCDQPGFCTQNCVDYWGNVQEGEVSMHGQCRGNVEGDRHVYGRYTPQRVDTLELDTREDYVRASSYHLDREHPEQSTLEYYIWQPTGLSSLPH